MDGRGALGERAGWDEYRQARARYLARVAELALIARLERVWEAPAAERPAPREGLAPGGPRPD